MKPIGQQPIRRQILGVNLIVIALSIVLALGSRLYLTLRQERNAMDKNLMNSARLLSQMPELSQSLEMGMGNEVLWNMLDEAIQHISDIDVIVLADKEGKQYYYPDRSYKRLPHGV